MHGPRPSFLRIGAMMHALAGLMLSQAMKPSDRDPAPAPKRVTARTKKPRRATHDARGRCVQYGQHRFRKHPGAMRLKLIGGQKLLWRH